MGEAARRRKELSNWLGGLPEPERVLAEVALRAYSSVVRQFGMTGMCYQMSFFLREFLALEHGIDTTVRVGFVNDGTDDIMISHAWIEHDDKITDITLHSTVAGLRSGSLLVVGQPLSSGSGRYTYHLEKGGGGLVAEEEFAKVGGARAAEVVSHKRAEHERMLVLADDRAAARRYLDAADNGLTYERLAELTGGRFE